MGKVKSQLRFGLWPKSKERSIITSVSRPQRAVWLNRRSKSLASLASS